MPQLLLGLVPGDAIDAIDYHDTGIVLPPPVAIDPPGWPVLPGGGWNDAAGMAIFWHFSVGPRALGAGFKPMAMPPRLPSDVNNEVLIGRQWKVVPANPNEAHGGYFFTSAVFPPGMPGGIGSNLLAGDEEALGLAILNNLAPPPVHDNDDLNGLDLHAALVDSRPNPLPPGSLVLA